MFSLATKFSVEVLRVARFIEFPGVKFPTNMMNQNQKFELKIHFLFLAVMCITWIDYQEKLIRGFLLSSYP